METMVIMEAVEAVAERVVVVKVVVKRETVAAVNRKRGVVERVSGWLWWRWAVEMGEGGGGQDEGREQCLPSEASQLEQVAGWVGFRGAQHGSARPVKWTRAERQGKHAPSEDPNHRLFEQPRP